MALPHQPMSPDEVTIEQTDDILVIRLSRKTAELNLDVVIIKASPQPNRTDRTEPARDEGIEASGTYGRPTFRLSVTSASSNRASCVSSVAACSNAVGVALVIIWAFSVFRSSRSPSRALAIAIISF